LQSFGQRSAVSEKVRSRTLKYPFNEIDSLCENSQAINAIISISCLFRPWPAWRYIVATGGTVLYFDEMARKNSMGLYGAFIRCVGRFQQSPRHSDLLFIPDRMRVESSTPV
jgi:hypothetical protein